MADERETKDDMFRSEEETFPARRLFGPGEIVSERYRITRHLATGGMGEVYAVEDTLLHEKLALKTIRRASATDERALERFKREIHLARKVTHPNVCRLFDVGFHRPRGDEPPVVFLTMELLDGETLEHRLIRQGRMTPEEATPLVAQMLAGLAAAHRAGVVHRDFKSANVVLCREGEGLRAVITDFGLARHLVDSSDASVTGDGGIVGSPGYMAPEQVEGRGISPATDLYAFGVVLYEMVTGQLPFVGESALATAAKRLKEEPVPPSAKVRELDPRWEATILRCLARKPEDRFAGAGDVAAALFGSSAELSRAALVESTQIPLKRSRVLPWVLAGTTAGALVLAAVAFVSPRAASTPPDQNRQVIAPKPARTSVAVFGFRNLSGRADAEWLSTALGEMLTTELATGELIRTVPSETVARARRELQLGPEDSFAPDTLAKLRGKIGSDYVLVGSYVALGTGGKLRFDLKLQSAQTGEVIASISETGTEAELVNLVARVGRSLRERLGVAALTESQEEVAAAMFPSRPEAIRLYTEGTAALNMLECPRAYDLLGKAVAGDPSFPLARSAYAMAASCVGHHERALVEAKTAIALAEHLPEHVRRAVQAFYHLLAEDFDTAAEIYGSLFEVFPENFDYAVRLAHAQSADGQMANLEKTIAAMRRLPAPLGTSIRIDHLVMLHAMNTRSAADDVLLVRAKALEDRAELEGNRPMAGEAVILEVLLHARMANWEKMEVAARRQLVISQDIGDQDGVVIGHTHLSAALRNQGKREEARNQLAKAWALSKEIGDTRREPQLRQVQGNAALDDGDLDAARKLMEENVENTPRAIQRRGSLGQLALIHYWQGNFAGAEAKALEVRSQLDATTGPEIHYNDGFLALLAFQRGEAGAVGRMASALEKLEAMDTKPNVHWPRENLANAYDLLGRTAEAEPLARASGIGHVLIRILARAGKIEEARQVLATTRQSPRHGEPLFLWELKLLMDEANIEAATGTPAGVNRARQLYDDVAARSAAAGLVGLALEARLAYGQISVAAGDVDGGRALLASVAKEARARGHLQVAERATK